MFNSTVLDVAIWLIFTFLALSLAVSAFVEAIASIMKWRSGTLLQGVKDLLNDQQFNGLAREIYNHALVNPRDSGSAQTENDLKHPPAYIQPKQFADALIDLAQLTKDSPEKIKSTIDVNVADKQINNLLKGIVDRTTGDVVKIRDELATWFDNGMDRISGAYKRKTQVWSFFTALIIAGLFNVNSINVGMALWRRPMIARMIAPQADIKGVEAFQTLINLDVPIGWTQDEFRNLSSVVGVEILLGWLITAVATLFGAPFWFDALQQIVRLKGAGPSPAENSSNSGAAA